MRLYLRILEYLRPYLPVFLAAVAASFLFAGLDAFSLALLIPFLRALLSPASEGDSAASGSAGEGVLDRLLDATAGRFVGAASDPLETVQALIVLILVVFAVKNVFDFMKTYLGAMVEQGVTRDIRNEVYDHLMDLDLVFFGRTRIGQIVSRLTHDVEQVRTLVTKEITRAISSFFELAAAFLFMVLISLPLTLLALVVLPGTMAIWGPMLKRLRSGNRRVLHLAGEVNAHVQETLSGIRLVKASASEAHERSRFQGLTDHYFRTFLRTERIRALAAPITEMVAALGTVAILWYGARLVLVEGVLTGPEFMTFVVLSTKLYAPVKYLSKLPATLQPGLVGGERVFEFLDAPIEIRDQPDARPFPGVETDIVYDRVGFGYREDQAVLDDVSVRVPRGSVVALVGPSGAGKSTMADLLGRFFEVTSGSILIDGTDIRRFQVRSLRQKMGIVSQETVLFHDTVRANIAYGLSKVDNRDVEEAARAAHAHEFICALPLGYETVVGERGAELSGGQRQRLAIARAILRDPPILVFDEATSSLDVESERLVQRAVERLLEGRTVFVIAHRLSTVQRADQILVLDGGRIVERGDHAGLMEADALYRRLYEMQFVDDGAATASPRAYRALEATPVPDLDADG